MARFTKYNNPNKKKRRKKLDYTERSIMAAKEMLADSRLGYYASPEYYQEKWNLKGEGKDE